MMASKDEPGKEDIESKESSSEALKIQSEEAEAAETAGVGGDEVEPAEGEQKETEQQSGSVIASADSAPDTGTAGGKAEAGVTGGTPASEAVEDQAAMAIEEPPPSQVSTNVTAVMFGIIFWGTVIGIFTYNYLGLGDPEPDIVVTASPNYDSVSNNLQDWTVSGHVIYGDTFVPGIGVWAIAVDQRGNRMSTGRIDTGADGGFELANIPNSLTGLPRQSIIEIEVHASGKITSNNDEIELNPDPARVGVGSGQLYRVINLPVNELIVIGLVFTLSVAVALIPVPQGSRTTAWLVGKYLSSVFFAFLLTGFMVLYISLGLRHVNQTASNVENEILSLGVASIYKGRYVDDVPKEWLISLTSPTFAEPIRPSDGTAETELEEAQSGTGEQAAATVEAASPGTGSAARNELERGFGAPLWVLLVAVIGSALFTISIILIGIKEAPLQLRPEEIRTRIQAVVLHQFYILFAPIGAIFVYQLLVMAGAASQTVSVAIVALAAGIALSYILEQARTSLEGLISNSR